MAITNNTLRDALFRIEPTEGLVQYVNVVKPYHTKILDILVEHIFAEPVNVHIGERWSWIMEFTRPNVETTYNCGYGLVWDQPVGAVSSSVVTIIKADVAIANDQNSNSFLVQPSYGVPRSVSVANVLSNTFAFVTQYNIISVNIPSQKWTISGNQTAIMLVGTKVYINGNTGGSNGTFTVVSSVLVAGNTEVTVLELLQPATSGNGLMSVAVGFEALPPWLAGTAITIAGPTLPAPLLPATKYYFAPTPIPGFFNITTKRFPNEYTDFVDVSTFGIGAIVVSRAEVFMPGDTVDVYGSFLSRNDGRYIVSTTVDEGLNVRVFVLQKVVGLTPVTALSDGIMTLNFAGFDNVIFCPASSASDLHLETFIHETLTFEFGINLRDRVGAAISELEEGGFGITPWSNGVYGPYGTITEEVRSRTALTSGLPLSSGTHILLPTGFDTQLWDFGGVDETLPSVADFYGRSV